MATKCERNYLLDAALLIIGFACIISGILLDLRPQWMAIPFWFRPMHTYTGYILAALVLGHLALHFGWIGSVTKSIFQDKRLVLALAVVIIASIAACYFAATIPSSHRGYPGGFPGGLRRGGAPF